MTKKTRLKIFFMLCLIAILALMPSVNLRASALTIDDVKVAEIIDGVDTETGEIVEEEPNEDTSSAEYLFDGVVLTNEHIPDDNLYSALLKVYRLEYKGTDRYYAGTSIYSDMFKDIKEINLDSSKTRLAIESLEGMQYLELNSLESFSANINLIKNFNPKYFQNTDIRKFKQLSLAGNLLESIDLTGLNGLEEVNLSSNTLTKVDFGKIEGKAGGQTHVKFNVAGNKISKMSDIILPTRRIAHVTLNIISNNITSIADEFFSEMYTMQIGVQGFSSEEEIVKVDTKEKVKIYKTGIENLSIAIYKIDGNFDEHVTTVPVTEIEGNYQTLDLAIGQYEYVYILDGEDAYLKNDIDRRYLSSHKFNIVPQQADHVFVFKGKEYKNLGKVTGVVDIKFSSPEDAKIFYSMNGGEWAEGSSVVCDKGGNYIIKVKTVKDGYESEVKEIWLKTSLNIYIPDVLMLVLVLLIALTLFFVVLPIVSKKYFKRD